MKFKVDVFCNTTALKCTVTDSYREKRFGNKCKIYKSSLAWLQKMHATNFTVIKLYSEI